MNKEEWRAYWQEKGFPWRTEPEIDAKRQEELSKCRAIVPDIKKGVYPFKGVKLNRADVEWLLVTHEGKYASSNYEHDDQWEKEGLDVRGANLRDINLKKLPLRNLHGGVWDISLTEQQITWAAVHLENADLSEAHLEKANLVGTHLEKANLYWTHLEGADLGRAHLEGASLRGAFLDNATDLDSIKLGNKTHGFVSVVDVHWGDANLAVAGWESVEVLGEERRARQKRTADGKKKEKKVWLREYRRAVRANRQLAVALQSQGLDEVANRFAYRAQILQRKLLWKQRNFWKWLGSAILALLAGYGYRMWRIIVAYLLIVLLCAGAYFVLGMYYEPHLSLLEAILTSITAFHGRVFSEPFLRPGEPQLWVTAFEAVAGLVIEGVFIAMLTQKFFGK